MKILITGNMGYVGTTVVRHLRNRFPDATLIGLDIGYFARLLTDSEILPESRLDVQYYADVRAFPVGVLDGVDAVVHLAAISNDPMGKAFNQVTFDVNYHSSVKLAKRAREAGVTSFVFASSCSMYGTEGEGAKSESSRLNPLTAYAQSKVLTEKALRPLAGDSFKVTCLRFSTACGMSERLRLDLVLNDFVAGAVAAKQITILSDGSSWRPLMNVKDMALAIEWAIGRRIDEGGEYLVVNVGRNDWNWQIKELAEAVAQVIPGVKIAINKEARPDKRSYKVSFDLYRELAPDHQPRYDLVSTIEELRQGLEAMGFEDANFRDSDLMRLKLLRRLRERNILNDRLEWTGTTRSRGC